jgi:hypothetical protein
VVVLIEVEEASSGLEMKKVLEDSGVGHMDDYPLELKRWMVYCLD